jgi:hypothetical protein
LPTVHQCQHRIRRRFNPLDKVCVDRHGPTINFS